MNSRQAGPTDSAMSDRPGTIDNHHDANRGESVTEHDRVSFLAAINTKETRAIMARTRDELYTGYTAERATAFLTAAHQHHTRKTAQTRTVTVVLFATMMLAFAATAYDYITGNEVSPGLLLVPLISVACTLVIGVNARRDIIGDADHAVSTVHDAHTLHQARQRNT